MEEHIKEYIYMLKEKYLGAIITKEFYKDYNILVRATQNNIIKILECILNKGAKISI